MGWANQSIESGEQWIHHLEGVGVWLSPAEDPKCARASALNPSFGGNFRLADDPIIRQAQVDFLDSSEFRVLLDEGNPQHDLKGMTDSVLFLAALTGRELYEHPLVIEEGRQAQQDPALAKAVLFKAIQSDNPAAIDHLATLGCDLNVNKGGLPALNAAIYADRDNCVRSLLLGGADPNTFRDVGRGEGELMGQTALMDAVDHGNPRIVGHLLDAGADISFTNDIGQTALSIAKMHGHSHTEELIVQSMRAREAEALRQQLEANTAPAPARYATDDWLPDASNALEARLAAEAGGEGQAQQPVRQRGMRL